VKQVIITGGAGFLGSHLAELLVQQGEHVTVLDNETSGSPDNLWAVRDHFDFHYVRGAVEDRALLRSLLHGADEVYHLTNTAGVERLAQAPADTILKNLEPLQILLDELRLARTDHHSIQLFLASSCEVYGHNPQSQWSEEYDLVLGPSSQTRGAYAAEQCLAEYLTLAMARQYGLPVIIGRIFPTIGARQSIAGGKVLPRLIAHALAGKPPVVHDDGLQVRTFAHVSDVVHAMADLMSWPGAVGQVFNLGSEEMTTILALAERVVTAIDSRLDIEFENYRSVFPPDFADLRRVVPDLSKLKNTISYSPQFTMEAAINEAIEWQRRQ
jgi:UDP-glucose 4-epimerase